MSDEKTPATADKAAQGEKKDESKVTKMDKSVSQRLFSDLNGRNIPGVSSIPDMVDTPLPIPEDAKKPEIKATPEVKPGPKYLSLEDFADSVVKLKVDGVEEDAKFQDIIRRVQLDKHLTSKGQKLSEEEKRIQAKEASLIEKEKILTELLANQNQTKNDDSETESLIKDDPYVKRLEADLLETKKRMQEIDIQTAPMRLNASLERVDKFAKDSLGLTDFMDYRVKIQDELRSLPPEVARGLDNESGWLTVFKDIKLKELMAQVAEHKKSVPSETKSIERVSPSIVPIESSRGSSKGFSDDDSSKYRSLFEKAKRLTAENNPERHKAWEEVLAFSANKT